MKRRLYFSVVFVTVTMFLIAANGFASSLAAPVPAEKVELHIVSRMIGDVADDNLVLRELEERLNLDLTWEGLPTAEYSDQMRMRILGGQWPDAMEFYSLEPYREIRELAEDGVALPLDDLLEEYGQNILAVRPYEKQWYRPLDDGLVYSIPSRFPNTPEQIWIIREDWLDSLGLDMPTDLDELYDVAKAFTFDDPDGNGKDDTYAISAGPFADGRGSVFDLILAAHGVLRTQWETVDGRLTHWAVRPETKEALRYFRKLFQEGLVDPEYPLQSRAMWLENMKDNRYGMHYWWATHLDAGDSDWWYDFAQSMPQAEVGFLAPFEDPYGQKRYLGGGLANHGFSVIVLSTTKHPERVIQLLDFLASEEGSQLASFGIENEHWEQDENGYITIKPMSREEMRQVGSYSYSWFFRRQNVMTFNPLVEAVNNTYMPFLVRPQYEVPTPTELELGPALDDLVENRITNIIMGEDIDVDEEFERFVTDWYRHGGDEITKEYNEIYGAN